MLSCAGCGKSVSSRRVERTRHVAGHAFTASLPATVCRACGEAYFADSVVARFDLEVAAALANAGIDAPEALRFMRQTAGLKALELAALLDVRAETVSRWERGKRPVDRPTFALLRQLVLDRLHDHRATADYLQSLGRPKRLSRRVTMRLGHAA